MLPRLLSAVAFLLLPVLCLAGPATFRAERAPRIIQLTGFTRPRATLDIVSEVSGRCQHVYADIGDTIPKDGIFARIDSTLARIDLETLRVEERQARRQLQFDELQVERFGRLLSTKASSRSRLDELELRRDRSRLQLDILAAKKKRLEEILSRHTVRAPAGWRLSSRKVEEGQWVRTGAILGKAGDYSALIVPLALTTTELKGLRSRSRLEVRLPDLNLHGLAVIHRVSPAFDPVTRKIPVEIRLQPELMDRLTEKRSGLRVEIDLILQDPMHSFLVPAAAVEERYEEHWLTREDGRKIRVIVLGPADLQKRPGKWLRVVSPEIRPGDAFLLPDSK